MSCDNSSLKQYTELTPVTFINQDNEVTHAKVPYYISQDSVIIPNAQQRYCEDVEISLGPNSQCNKNGNGEFDLMDE